jgi:hypothetical protein
VELANALPHKIRVRSSSLPPRSVGASHVLTHVSPIC